MSTQQAGNQRLLEHFLHDVQSGKLPEYKKWIDPQIIERHWQEHEKALDRDEAARKAKVAQQRKEMQERLEAQIKEQEAAKAAARREEEVRCDLTGGAHVCSRRKWTSRQRPGASCLCHMRIRNL